MYIYGALPIIEAIKNPLMLGGFYFGKTKQLVALIQLKLIYPLAKNVSTVPVGLHGCCKFCL